MMHAIRIRAFPVGGCLSHRRRRIFDRVIRQSDENFTAMAVKWSRFSSSIGQ